MTNELNAQHVGATVNGLEHQSSSNANDFHNPIQIPDDHAEDKVEEQSYEDAIAPFQWVIELVNRVIKEEKTKKKEGRDTTTNNI